jgi:hypothetical protein
VALAQTGLAIGSLSRFLAGALANALNGAPPYFPKITIQRPQAESSSGTSTHPRINLFLYEVEIDGAMRNIPLTPGSLPPLWVVLRYLLTAFDAAGESDNVESHDLLGQGMQVLMGVSQALPSPPTDPALTDNPEPLKLSFDQGTPDLLSRLMQGPDDKFRCSAAFQVRPVLIAQPQPPTGLQLIGVNYRLGTIIGLAGVRNYVLPNMGPQLDSVQPQAVEIGDTLTLHGNNLGIPGLTVNFASMALVPSLQQPQILTVTIAGLDPTKISAGNLTVSISETLASGLAVTSTAMGVALLPTLTGMTIMSIAAVSAINPNVYATITVAGQLLGGATDYVEFALVRDGTVALMLDTPDPAFTLPTQSQQRFVMPQASAVPPGVYFAVLRVNGQQAVRAITLNLVVP